MYVSTFNRQKRTHNDKNYQNKKQKNSALLGFYGLNFYTQDCVFIVFDATATFETWSVLQLLS